MTTSDYALIVSIFSAVIAIVALLWNVWQKFIFVRPTLQTSFGVNRIVRPNAPKEPAQRLLAMTVTNMGPGPIIVQNCIAKSQKHWWQRTKSYGLLNPIEGDPTAPNPRGIGPYGGGLPAKLDSGEVKQFYFPFSKECFLGENLARVGVGDTYHRMAWCPRSDMREANESYQRAFPRHIGSLDS